MPAEIWVRYPLSQVKQFVELVHCRQNYRQGEQLSPFCQYLSMQLLTVVSDTHVAAKGMRHTWHSFLLREEPG